MRETTLEDVQSIELINKIQKDIDSGAVLVRKSDGKRLFTVKEVLTEMKKGGGVKAFQTEKKSPGGIILP